MDVLTFFDTAMFLPVPAGETNRVRDNATLTLRREGCQPVSSAALTA